MTTKELAFEYLMDCFIDWYKSIKNDNSFHYSFTKLKVIKLLFFASAVNANNEDHNLLGTFNKFVAMPFGPVESDIYNKMNQSAIGKYCISDKELKIQEVSTENNEDKLSPTIIEQINESVDALRKINNRLVLYSAFDLVDLSHKWSCWRTTYSYARQINKGSISIPDNLIINSDKYLMSLFIKQARELYISTFSTANLKKYSEEDINIQLEGSARIDEYYKSVFILLSKAVLSGEYIFDPNYRKALDAFEADIAMEIGNIDTYFTQRFSDLSLGLKCILKHYVGFLINIEDKIKNSDEEFFFSAFKSDDKNINNEFLSDFISIVLKLASIDHFLIADNDNREILVILREELENRKKVENKDLKDIYSALLDKCNLLLVKMFYDPIIGRNYSLNFKKHSVDEIEFSESSLKETFNRYNFMFNSSFDKGLYKEQITKYQEKCISRHSKASELILLMKHYQKDNCSSRQVKNLLQSFDALYKSIYATKIKRKFDIVALNSIKNYLYNCKLSINLENPEYNY